MTSLEVQTPSISRMLGQQLGHRRARRRLLEIADARPQQGDAGDFRHGALQADGPIAGGRRRRRAVEGNDAALAAQSAIRAFAAL